MSIAAFAIRSCRNCRSMMVFPCSMSAFSTARARSCTSLSTIPASSLSCSPGCCSPESGRRARRISFVPCGGLVRRLTLPPLHAKLLPDPPRIVRDAPLQPVAFGAIVHRLEQLDQLRPPRLGPRRGRGRPVAERGNPLVEPLVVMAIEKLACDLRLDFG